MISIKRVMHTFLLFLLSASMLLFPSCAAQELAAGGFLALVRAQSEAPLGFTVKETEKYAEYRLYDPNLSYLSTAAFFNGKVKEEGTLKLTYYKTIKDADEVAFAAALWRDYTPLDEVSLCRFVAQNPESYVCVIDEWTVKELQLCLEEPEDRLQTGDGVKREASVYDNLPAKNGKAAAVKGVSSAEEFEQIRTARQSVPEAYRTGTDPLKNGDSSIYVRVCFEECEGIVWEAPVWIRDTDEGRIIAAEMTYPSADADGKGVPEETILIPNDTKLYQQINDYADSLTN